MDTHEVKGEESKYGHCEDHSIDDAPQQQKIDTIKQCEVCGARWKDKTGGKITACPSCGREGSLREVAAEFTDDTIEWFTGVTSLEELVTVLECKVEQLNQFSNEGWELDRTITDDIFRLVKNEPE